MADRVRTDVTALLELHVLGDVDNHGSGTSGRCDLERFVKHAREIIHVFHEPIVLCAGSGDADRIAFLEGVVADELGRHLTGQHDQRNRIHQRIRQPRHGVGGAGTRCHQHHARLAGRTGIALGSMDRALLMAHEHVDDIVGREERIVNRQHGAARITENVPDALVFQRPNDHFGTGQFDGSGRCRATHRAIVFVHRTPSSGPPQWATKAKGALPPLVLHAAIRETRITLARPAA